MHTFRLGKAGLPRLCQELLAALSLPPEVFSVEPELFSLEPELLSDAVELADSPDLPLAPVDSLPEEVFDRP